MPKGKKKGKESRRERERDMSSDDDSMLDNISECGSDLRSLHDDTECDEGEAGVGRLEEKVCELVEQLGAKAAPARTSALLALRTALCRRYMAHVLSGHRATLADAVSRALRKGKTAERRAAAALAPLLAIQVGEEGGQEFLAETRPALLALLQDAAAEPDLRADCCVSVSVLSLVLEQDVSCVLELLAAAENIFSGSYLKGDGSVKPLGAEVGTLHAAALDAWALLLPLVPPEHARATLLDTHARPNFTHLVQLLTAHSLETRISAGCALVVALEHACEGAPPPPVLGALPLLQELASDSNKFRAKRHRKTQRATFRDILKYLEEGEMESECVRIGAESVEVCGWAERGAYAALAGALGAGLQACAGAHLGLRIALRLPPAPPPPPNPRDLRQDKIQRQLQNAANYKARTISRNKSRDKRSALLTL